VEETEKNIGGERLEERDERGEEEGGDKRRKWRRRGRPE
jgi:hypothetical protein